MLNFNLKFKKVVVGALVASQLSLAVGLPQARAAETADSQTAIQSLGEAEGGLTPAADGSFSLDAMAPEAAARVRQAIQEANVIQQGDDGSAKVVFPSELPKEGTATAIEAVDESEMKLTVDAVAQPKMPEGSDDPAQKRNWFVRAQRKLWFVTLEMAALKLGVLVAFAYLPKEITHWGAGSAQNIVENFKKGPQLDPDGWSWNYIGHPISGAQYYLLARNRGGTWWQSLLYGFALSSLWEFVTEATYERASIQDLFITPVAGAVLGELQFQGRNALLKSNENNPRWWKKALVVVLDPLEAITNPDLFKGKRK